MKTCKNCNKNVKDVVLWCKTCGATFCTDCANDNQMICPYCYSTLDYDV